MRRTGTAGCRQLAQAWCPPSRASPLSRAPRTARRVAHAAARGPVVGRTRCLPPSTAPASGGGDIHTTNGTGGSGGEGPIDRQQGGGDDGENPGDGVGKILSWISELFRTPGFVVAVGMVCLQSGLKEIGSGLKDVGKGIENLGRGSLGTPENSALRGAAAELAKAAAPDKQEAKKGIWGLGVRAICNAALWVLVDEGFKSIARRLNIYSD